MGAESGPRPHSDTPTATTKPARTTLVAAAGTHLKCSACSGALSSRSTKTHRWPAGGGLDRHTGGGSGDTLQFGDVRTRAGRPADAKGAWTCNADAGRASKMGESKQEGGERAGIS